ncbi:516_t:CDS:1, partial [Entrophospora sp. SA101]
MTNVRTLQDINKGHRLGSMREQELEKKLYTALESKSEVNDLSEKLQNKYSKQVKNFDRERKEWNQERKQWESAFSNVTSDKQKLHTHALELIGETKQLKIENTNLTSENIRKDLSLAESKAENDTKSKKISSL